MIHILIIWFSGRVYDNFGIWPFKKKLILPLNYRNDNMYNFTKRIKITVRP